VSLAVVILIAVAVVYNSKIPSYTRVKTLSRNFTSAEQETALLTAENANYTRIFNASRFPNNDDNMLQMSPSFIDNQTVAYYNSQYGANARAKGNVFNYTANVYQEDRIQAFFENETNQVGLVYIIFSNGTELDKYSVHGMYAYNDVSGVKQVEGNTVDYEFSDYYLVQLNLEYSEVTGNLGGVFMWAKQTVIMNENYEILFIAYGLSNAVAWYWKKI